MSPAAEHSMPTKSKKARAQRRASGVGSGRMVSRLRRRYTRVVKMGDHWNTYLQIDHQLLRGGANDAGACPMVREDARRRTRPDAFG